MHKQTIKSSFWEALEMLVAFDAENVDRVLINEVVSFL